MIRFLLLLAAIGMCGVVTLQELRPQRPPTEGVSFDFNEGFPTFSSESLNFMSFGYSRVMSNLLWLRFLQNTPPKKMGNNEVSWIYLDLDAISTIDPEFEPVFHQGAIFLSVITEDKRGAELLLNKGTRLYPNDWQIHSYLAYHYQFELKDPVRAEAEYALAAKSPDSNPLMGLLAARLRAKHEGAYAAIELLRNLRDATDNPEAVAKYNQKILDLLSGKDDNKFHP